MSSGHWMRRCALLAVLGSGACSGGQPGPSDGQASDAGAADGADADRLPVVPDEGGVDGVDGGDGGDGAPARVDRCDPADWSVEARGDLAWGDSVTAELAPCQLHHHRFWASAGATADFDLLPLGPEGLLIAVTYPDTPTWDDRIAVTRADSGHEPGRLSFVVPRSGEFSVLLRAATPELAVGYDLSLSCGDGCELETTRNPIVLVHGWTGFESIGPVSYFYGVPEMLRERGFPVFVAELDPYNSVEVRSEQLALEVDRFLSDGRAPKVSIIAHSQGGLDSRRAISTLGYGDRVSALVTVATPHQGTPITDIALGLVPGVGDEALFFLLGLVGAAGGNESDAEASFFSLSEDYVRNVFNPSNPDDPRVSYISWTGLTCSLGLFCGDVCDVEIRWSYNIIYLAAGDNDGMVPVSSAPWGDYRGEIPADHFDEVGQLFGVTGLNFDHKEFYLQLARDLAAEGH